MQLVEGGGSHKSTYIKSSLTTALSAAHDAFSPLPIIHCTCAALMNQSCIDGFSPLAYIYHPHIALCTKCNILGLCQNEIIAPLTIKKK